MNSAVAVRAAALIGFLAVALGAFGAHSLKKSLEAYQTAAIWDTAVLYHAIHAVVLLLLAYRSPLRLGPYLAFLAGILVFSGTLYVLAATNTRWLGAITPIGGVCFLVGWAWLFFSPKVEHR